MSAGKEIPRREAPRRDVGALPEALACRGGWRDDELLERLRRGAHNGTRCAINDASRGNFWCGRCRKALSRSKDRLENGAAAPPVGSPSGLSDPHTVFAGDVGDPRGELGSDSSL